MRQHSSQALDGDRVLPTAAHLVLRSASWAPDYGLLCDRRGVQPRAPSAEPGPQTHRNSIAGYNIVSLQLFTSVFESGNIARAARDNHIAASAVSRRVSELELRVGATLFYRTKQGVEASPAGRMLYRHARRILGCVEMMDSELKQFSRGQRGRVRLWAHSSAVSEFLPEDLALFVQRHPNVRMDLHEENSEAIVRALLDGNADIGIFSEHVDARGLEVRIYRRDTLVVAVPRGHILGTQSSVGIEEIASCERVGLREGNSIEKKIQVAAKVKKITPHTRIQVSCFEAARRMVEVGIGIAVLPKGAVAPFLDSNELEMVPLREDWATRTLVIGFRDYASLPLLARRFVVCLTSDGAASAKAAKEGTTLQQV